MTRPLAPTDVRCKDGKTFSVRSRGGRIIVCAEFRDPAVVSSGLGRHTTFHEPGDCDAEHSGMPVEIVRAYARAHGGVAEAGEEALALLKALPSQADPQMGEPVTDSRAPALGEAAPESPLPEARAAAVARRASAPAAARALDGAVVEPAPRLQLDELTEAVIEARRAVADFEGPVVWKREWGRHRADELPETAALWKRITRGSGLASRLIIVTHPQYASHPLLAEGTALRAQLTALADEARRERDARLEANMRFHQRRNGVLPAEA